MLESTIQHLDVSALPIADYQRLCELTGLDPDLREWRALAGMDDSVFNVLIRPAFVRYAESAQLAPASEAHHHCGPGGLLLHTHDVVTLALKRRRALQLPLGGSISEIADKKYLWTLGVFAACLLHDIGKLASTIRVVLNLRNGKKRPWNPHDEPITAFRDALSYSIQFQKLPYEYHHQIAPTLFDILPRVARSWIANDATLMKQLCAHLRGDRFESGVIGEIAEAADMTSTARNLQLPMPKQRFSTAVPVIDRFIGAIRTWIKEGEVRINVNGGMGWVDEAGACYFVCRTLAEKLVRYCDDLGINDIPRDPIRIYDILQEHGYALPTPDGKAVWAILVKGQTVSGEIYEHRFTCLKFEARRLVVPTRMLSPLNGTIAVIDAADKAVKQPRQDTQGTSMAARQTEEQHMGDSAELVAESGSGALTIAKTAGADSGNAVPDEAEAPAALQETARMSLIFGGLRKELTSPPLEAAREVQNTPATARESVDGLPEPVIADAVEELHTHAPDTVRDTVEPEARECVGIKRVQDLNGKSKAVEEAGEPDEESGGAKKPAGGRKPWETGEQIVTSLPMYQGITIRTENIGKMFFNWLKKGLIERTILINTPVALVHIVEEGILLLSPGLFKDFCVKHQMPESDHRPLSRKFDNLKLGIKTEQRLMIHTFWAVGENRAGKVSGRLIPHHHVYGNDYPVPQFNKYFKRSFVPDDN
jgi:hypothetical protein